MTETSKPTPGPWRVAPASHYAGSELNIDAGDNGTGGYICSPGQRDDPEAIANARLIAAAPDLLAEAKAVVAKWKAQNWKYAEPTAAAIERLSHAISRAEGAVIAVLTETP